MHPLPPGFSFEPVDFDPFAPLQLTIPSTEPQREIFTSVLMGGSAANCAYNESVMLRLKGKLDPECMKKAFEAVIHRHDALRSTFSDDGTTLQILASLSDIPWKFTDARQETERDVLLNKLCREETLYNFSLTKGPLIRMHLVRFEESDHALLITGHHIVCDGWSLSLIIRDLGNHYSALVKNSSLHAEPALSFADYSRKLSADAASDRQSVTERFWVDQYTGDVPVMEFPPDQLRPPLRSFHAMRIDVPVPTLLVKQLRDLGKKNNSSFVTVMLSCFETFLYKITGQEDIVVGLPAAGQNAEGFYQLVGHCVNLLPLRSKIDPQRPFQEYLKDRKSYLFDAYEHQQFTFGSLVQKLNIPRDPSRIPIVPIVFNVDIGFTEGFHFEGCSFEAKTNPRYFDNFEIFLNASGDGDELTLECTFNTDLFVAESMKRRMEEFICYMQSITQAPGQPIATFNALPEEEIVFFRKVNDARTERHHPFGIHECILENTQYLKPGHIAIVSEEVQVTYEDALYRSAHYASCMQSRGVKAGDFIGICMPRNADLPIAMLGILRAGAAYLPLDPSLPAERLHFMEEDAGVKYILTTKELQSTFGFPTNKVLYAEVLNSESNGKPLKIHPVAVDTPAYILYTSGSTGKPKGVLVKHSGVTNLLQDLARKMGFDKEEKLLGITTVSFDISVLEIFMPLIHGGTLHFATREQSIDARWMNDYMKRVGIRFLQATPATYELLYTAGWEGKKDLVVLCGGEALRKELAIKLLRSNREVWNVYGPTETTIWSTAMRLSEEENIRTRNGVMSIGKPVANTRIYIMDTNGYPCPIGVPGELWIAGDGVSIGYLNRPELNKEKFIRTPEGEGMAYRTGDKVVTDKEGYLYFLNRFDFQVKVRGYRIELGEIETALNACQEIKQAVLMAVPDASGQNMLVCWYTAARPGEAEPVIQQSCRKQLSAKLPDYMLPARWVQLEEFPLSANGKVNRKALTYTEKAQEEVIAAGSNQVFTPFQEKIKHLWMDVLQTDKIGLHDDFFELGGHSLLAVKIIVELEKISGKKFPLAVLFTSPTIAELSKLYEIGEADDVWNPIVPLREGGTKGPIYYAHGISGNVFKYHALAQRLGSEQSGYGLQAYGLNGKDVPFHDMHEMAAYHVSALTSYQKEGPYKLAGGSFGGYLAYEMAVQLQAMGKEVGFLCLFDIDAAKRKEFLPQGVKQIVDARLLAGRFVKRAVELAMADKDERRSYFEARRKQQQRNNDIESWLEKHKMAEMIGSDSAAYFRRIEEACHDALMGYKIPRYDGDILLVRAKNSFYNNEYDKDLGWSHFTTGKVKVLTVPGDHNSIFWEPHVDVLAEELQKHLRSTKK